jgi:hypothetical protein
MMLVINKKYKTVEVAVEDLKYVDASYRLMKGKKAGNSERVENSDEIEAFSKEMPDMKKSFRSTQEETNTEVTSASKKAK